MWERIFLALLQRGLRAGRLHLTMPDGSLHHLGPGGDPEVSVTLNARDFPRRFLRRPDLTIGEAYMAGQLVIAGDDIRSFVTLLLRNTRGRRLPRPLRLLAAVAQAPRTWAVWNHMGRSRRNVAHHYDLSPALYDLFLGETKQYTCAYFRRPDMSLNDAQRAKMDHIAAKLLLHPGMRVLDIGCGFGTLAIKLARDHGVQVVGITLSDVQIAEARRRAAEAGLGDQVEFRLQDYRDVPDSFDRVLSVGMMEHVGKHHLPVFFQTVARLLPADGVALIHYIGRSSPPAAISPWFDKYIFPGAYCPSISETTRVVERSGLLLADLEVWRGHYERTLQEWLRLFDRNIDKVRALYDDRFVRMWRYYLQSAELSFSEASLVIHQLQLSRSRLAVPDTRDYLYLPSKG